MNEFRKSEPRGVPSADQRLFESGPAIVRFSRQAPKAGAKSQPADAGLSAHRHQAARGMGDGEKHAAQQQHAEGDDHQPVEQAVPGGHRGRQQAVEGVPSMFDSLEVKVLYQPDGGEG